MISKTNIESQLVKVRKRRVSDAILLQELEQVLEKNKVERLQIKQTLQGTPPSNEEDANTMNLNLLSTESIFHLQDIKKLCVEYRLRFLDAHFFKGEFPSEAISKIRHLQKQHNTTLQGFKIMAPAKLLRLENADDPVLFAPLGNDYFYLLHKWGNDLHPFRKILMWPYKSFENLVFTVFLISLVLTILAPMKLFTHTPATQEYVLLFLFMFKAVGGIVLFYGFAKGKNFNGAIWDSRYYNG